MAMGRTDRIPYLGPYPVRTANIHCVLRFEAFTILEREIYFLISDLGLRTPRSHALRTKNIHCVLCFGASTFSERIMLLHSPALGLPRVLYLYKALLDSRALRFETLTFSEHFW